MDKVFRYSLRRGLLIVLILQPFFKVLLLLYTYEVTDHAKIEIPLLPRTFRMLFPAKLSLAFHGNLIELSLHVFWRWMEKIYGRFLSPPASDLSSLGPLGILQEILAGRPVVRLNLRGAPKRQIILSCCAGSSLPDHGDASRMVVSYDFPNCHIPAAALGVGGDPEHLGNIPDGPAPCPLPACDTCDHVHDCRCVAHVRRRASNSFRGVYSL